MNVVELIIQKRDGHAVEPAAIRALVDAFTRGDVPEYQVSAFLMAAFLRGLSDRESTALTEAMLHSGEVLDLSSVPGLKVDKHSTGGVGDKISIALAPLVAAAGVPVPMISGRGLGHTGGTLDKLEAIPGFRTDLNVDQYRRQLGDIGVVMIGQTSEIAPADKKLYALRDVTGTVEFIPFIASSIMSKKLAEGIDALVLDVKWGRGAFMKTEADARRLAETLAAIGTEYGKPTVAWLTDMNAPLGYEVGNWLETKEAIAVLRGEQVPEVTELVETLAGEMIWLGGKAATPEAGTAEAAALLRSGAAFEKFVELVRAQGGDVSVVENPALRESRPVCTVEAPEGLRGTITSIDPYALGRIAIELGAGRKTADEAVDPLAGLTILKKPGDFVQPGEPIMRLHTLHSDRTGSLSERAAAAFSTAGGTARGDLLVDRYWQGTWRGAR